MQLFLLAWRSAWAVWCTDDGQRCFSLLLVSWVAGPQLSSCIDGLMLSYHAAYAGSVISLRCSKVAYSMRFAA